MCPKRHKGFDGLSLNNLCPRGSLSSAKNEPWLIDDIVSVFISCDSEQDTEYGYACKGKRDDGKS